MFQLFPTGRTSRGAEQQSTGCEGRIIVSYSPSREPSPGMNDVTDLTAGSPAVVMLMRGCGGDITDPACLVSSLITRLCLQIIILFAPWPGPAHLRRPTLRGRFIIRNNYRLQEETEPGELQPRSGNKIEKLPTCPRLTC